MEVQKENEEPIFEYSDGEEVQPEVHNKLLNAVSHIYKKQRIEKPQRREPTSQISEFNLSNKSSENNEKLVDVSDLVKILNKRATHHEIKKKVNVMKRKSKPLPKPIEKLHADKIRRQLGYLNVRKQLNRWEALVQRNRAAEQLKFPLQPPGKVVIKESHDFLNTFKEPTELEKEMAAVLQTSETAQEEKKKEEELFPLSLEEIIERRKMIAHMRARESYRIAKATRQNKIKSKKYHRILKRERIKKELKDFEILQKTNPEAALEKLEKIERARAEERITLRHRNTGKWARSRAIRAKYDTEARAQLAEQLAKSRELTRKVQSGINSSSEEDYNEAEEETLHTDPSNPWQSESENPNSEITTFLTGFRKYQSEKKNEEIQKKDENSIEKVTCTSLKSENSDLLNNSSSNGFNNSVLNKESSVVQYNESVITSEVNDDCNILSNTTASGDQSGDDISVSEGEDKLPNDNLVVEENGINEEIEKKLKDHDSSPLLNSLDTHNVELSECLSSIANNQTDGKIKSGILRTSPKNEGDHQLSNIVVEEEIECVLSNHTDLEMKDDSASKQISTHLEETQNNFNLEENSSFSKKEKRSKTESKSDLSSEEEVCFKKREKMLKSSSNTKKYQVGKKRFPNNLTEDLTLLEDSEKNKVSEVSKDLEKFLLKNKSSFKRSNETKVSMIPSKKKIKRKEISNVITPSGLWTVSAIVPDKRNINYKEKDRNGNNRSKNNNLSIDKIFDNAENDLKKSLDSHINVLKTGLNNEEEEEEATRKSKKAKYRADLSFKPSNKRLNMDSTLIEVATEGISSGKNDIKSLMDIYTTDKKTDKPGELSNIDPHKFLPVKPSKLNSGGIDLVEEQAESADEEDVKKRQLNLEEAFADDDVVEEFRREKEEDIEKSKPKEIDLRLPGWGHWAGHNIDPTPENKLKRKTRRLIIKFPEIPRKDDKKDYVIINEEIPSALKSHMVHDLPFPFKSVKDYETSIRAPIGNTWVPRSAFMKLVRPAVVTKMGSIIQPISETELLNFEKKKIRTKKK